VNLVAHYYVQHNSTCFRDPKQLPRPGPSVAPGYVLNIALSLTLEKVCASFSKPLTWRSHSPGKLGVVSAAQQETRVQARIDPVLTPAQIQPPATQAPDSVVRRYLMARGNSALADRGFHGLMVLSSLSIFGIVVLIAGELVIRSQLAWNKFGLSFSSAPSSIRSRHRPSYWDPVNGHFSALPFVYGTLVTSFLALLMAVPLAIGLAIFLTEMCPRFLRGPLSFITELLAAIPASSMVFGLSSCWFQSFAPPLTRR